MKGRLVVWRTYNRGKLESGQVKRVVGYRGVDGKLYDKVSEAWIATKKAPTEELEDVRPMDIEKDLVDEHGYLVYDGVLSVVVDPKTDEMKDPSVLQAVKDAIAEVMEP